MTPGGGGDPTDLGAAGAGAAGDLFSGAVGSDLDEVHRWLRENDPVHWDPRAAAWFVARHAAAAAVLRDPVFAARPAQQSRRRDGPAPTSMLDTDGADHDRLRRGTAAVATGARLRAVAARVAARLPVQPWAAGRPAVVDVIAEIARPTALDTMVELFRIDDVDRDRFGRAAERSGLNLDPLGGALSEHFGSQASAELAELFAARYDGSRDHGGLVEAFARGDVDHGLDRDEVLATCVLLVVGGFEPLVHAIGNGVLALLQTGTWSSLARDPSLLAPAVDELLRFDAPIPFAARVATRGTAIAGVEIAAGDLVVTLLASANHDPDAFDDPDRLDLTRRSNPQLGFGAGPHRCFGADLTRTVVRAVLAALVDAWPDPRLVGEPVRTSAMVPRGLRRLEVRTGW